MIHALSKKRVNVVPPAAIVNNAAVTCAEIDTIGFDLCEIVVQLGATDIALSALKVQETDTSGSGYADIVGTRFGTDNNDAGVASTLPSATDDNHFFSIVIDCRGGRKRYLKPAITVGNGTTGAFVECWAELSRASEGPRTAVQAGLTQRLIV